MRTNRLEAFSDGVIAIIITIMVLELKARHDPDIRSLVRLWPTFSAYVLSFAIIAIYWVNHHHLIHAVTRVDAAVLWTNMNLLFWLSVVPWATVYLGVQISYPSQSRYMPRFLPRALFLSTSCALPLRAITMISNSRS